MTNGSALGLFLRWHRQQLTPHDVGLPGPRAMQQRCRPLVVAGIDRNVEVEQQAGQVGAAR